MEEAKEEKEQKEDTRVEEAKEEKEQKKDTRVEEAKVTRIRLVN
jgi:hypothetical protein